MKSRILAQIGAGILAQPRSHWTTQMLRKDSESQASAQTLSATPAVQRIFCMCASHPLMQLRSCARYLPGSFAPSHEAACCTDRSTITPSGGGLIACDGTVVLQHQLFSKFKGTACRMTSKLSQARH